MSFHSRQQLPGIKDEPLLLQTLRVLGYEFEQHAEPVQVRGYRNEIIATQCRLVIRREKSNLGADMGFVQSPEGDFTLVSDSYAIKNLGEITNTLKRTYEQQRAFLQARQLGFTKVQQGTWIERNGKKYLQAFVTR